MDLLDHIILHKLHEVDANRKKRSTYELEESIFFKRPCKSLVSALKGSKSTGIIAEFKRRSPARQHLQDSISAGEVAKGYEANGVDGISILTDQKYFGGSGEDFVLAREVTPLPMLHKDFIVDEYQITEAKAMGADVILLIARILTPFEIERFAAIAESIGMETLLQVHNKEELDRALSLNPHVHMIGVNNQNLNTLKTDLNNSLALAPHIPDRFIKIAEGGINTAEEVKKLRMAGYRGFLIGSSFMDADSPVQACADFMKSLQSYLV